MMISMLTTTDNPHDPFDEWDSWFAFDARLGHHTPSVLARIVKTSSELSENQQTVDIDRAIDTIIRRDVLGLYKKVTREVED